MQVTTPGMSKVVAGGMEVPWRWEGLYDLRRIHLILSGFFQLDLYNRPVGRVISKIKILLRTAHYSNIMWKLDILITLSRLELSLLPFVLWTSVEPLLISLVQHKK